MLFPHQTHGSARAALIPTITTNVALLAMYRVLSPRKRKAPMIRHVFYPAAMNNSQGMTWPVTAHIHGMIAAGTGGCRHNGLETSVAAS